jgi:phage recombination protein Bet
MKKRRPKRRPKRHAPKKKSANRSSTAIVKPEVLRPATAVTATGRIRKLSEDEVSLLKRTVAKGTSDDEFAMFLWFCRNHQVDPVAGEVYCIMRWDSKRDVVGTGEDGKPIYQGGMKMTITMGIGGLRGLAARKHKDYGSTDDPVWEFGTRKTKALRRIPESVSVAVWKKGAARPTRATIFWDEFAPKDLENEPWKHDFWNRSPANQLAKCCEAQALRKSYPDLNNIYIPEELAQTDQDYTPSGRQIVTQSGTSPSGKPLTYEAQHRGELSETAAHGYPAGSEKAKQAEETLRRVEEADKAALEARKPLDWKAQHEADKDAEALRQARTVLPKAEVPKEQPKAPQPPANTQGGPILEAESINPDRFQIFGFVPELLPVMEQCCKSEDGFWFCTLEGLNQMRTATSKYKFQLKVVPSSKPVEKRASPSNEKKKQEEPELITGLVEQVNEKMTKGGPKRPSAPYLSILFRGSDNKKVFYSVFDHDMFKYIEKAKGTSTVCELFIKRSGDFANVVGLKRIGSVEFQDGKIPVVQQKDREAGQKTLY